jgi:hypothetical protein
MQSFGGIFMGASFRFVLLLLLALLAACSPKFDWRQMPAADNAVQVMFPARPHTDTHDVKVAGHVLPLTFTMADVDSSIFAVGYAKLPDEVVNDPAELGRVADAFEQVLRDNLHGVLKQRTEIPLKQGPYDKRKLFRAAELEIHGQVADKPSWLLGRVYVLGNMMIEVVAVGTEKALPREAAQTFVQSLRAD